LPGKPTNQIKQFKPRARLLLLLGDELIRDEAMAVFELVKNAYDADASTCLIELQNVGSDDPEEASIVIDDDGVGMDLDTVTNVWMEPGTDYRKEQRAKKKRSRKYKRLPIGEKGVGRFAVHKLGKQTTIVTRKRGCDEIVIDIDWTAFETTEYLSDVQITIRTREPELFTGKQTGTRITASQLRVLPWSKRKVRWLYRAVTSINSPFDDESSFSAQMEVHPESEWLIGLLEPQDVLQHAVFYFEGHLRGSYLDYKYEFRPPDKLSKMGIRTNKVVRFPLSAQQPLDPATTAGKSLSFANELPSGIPEGSVTKGAERIDLDNFHIGDVIVQFYLFDLESKLLKLTLSDPKGLRDYMNENGGVRVYRDGVRVYDFGEPGTDWLDLEGRRVNVPAQRIGNNQIIGAVFLNLTDSIDLVEKTNREGFVEDNAFHCFREAIGCAVAQAAAERNRDKRAIRNLLKPQQKQPVLDDLHDLRSELDKRQVNGEVTAIVNRIEKQYQHVSEYLLLAAGTGLNMAAIIHQVEKEVKSLGYAIAKEAPRERIVEIARRLGEMTDTAAWLLRDSPRANLPVAMLIENAIGAWPYRLAAHGIEVTNGIANGNPEFSIKGSRRLLMSALMNLVDNSIYWLDTNRDSTPRVLYIGTTFEMNGKPAIVVADNGPGLIDPIDELVQPFFSRKQSGSGLGLHITNEIMKDHGGALLEASQGDITLPNEYDGAILLMEFPKTL
jgi:signal transduction histidine kinase